MAAPLPQADRSAWVAGRGQVSFAGWAVCGVLFGSLLVQYGPEFRDPTARFALTELQADFRQLRELITANHPLYFTDRGELEAAFDRQYALLEDSLTTVEFHRLIAPAVAAARCGHTRLSLPPHVSKYFADSGGYLPYEMRVIRDSLYVLDDFTESPGITPGARIVAINGLPTADIIKRIRRCLPADGRNQTYKAYLMNEGFRNQYLTFVDDPDTFAIVLAHPDTREETTAVIAAISGAEIRSLREARRSLGPREPLVETSISGDGGYALMKVRFFDFADDPDEFVAMMNSFLGDMSHRDVRSLILDLRGNDGGDPYSSALLLGFLLAEPFPYFAPESTFLNRNLKRQQPVRENRFTGDLYVLDDGGCYSTTGHFCSLLKHYDRGVFIGVETGGSAACNGGYKEHTLSHTGIQLLLPYTTFIAAAEGLPRGRGIEPDHVVEPSIADLIDGADPALKKAIALIGNSTP